MSTILLINLHLFQSQGVFLRMAISAQIFQDAGHKVMMEEIIEVGKHFILYKVKEVGLIPMGGVWITQLVAPLKSHLSVFLHFLLLIVMVFFPCFFRSSAVFGKLDRVSGRDEVQSRFSDSLSMV